MKYLSFLSLLIIVFSIACQGPKTSETEETAEQVTLSVKWETDTLLTTCESVIYDKSNDILYVSNINGDPKAKDGNGSIAKVTLDGKISDPQWIKGLNAPKGLGLSGGKLYVADIDKIVEIDIAGSKILNSYAVDSALFLNDIAVDASGRVYASDSEAKNVVVLENGKVSVWLDNLSSGPNGLLAEDNRMLLALWDLKTLNTVDLVSKEITEQTDSLENPDGIEAVGDGGYLISSWNGLIHYVDSNWKSTLILDTSTDKVSAADIEYIQEKNLLLIPTFFKNKVVAYELKK